MKKYKPPHINAIIYSDSWFTCWLIIWCVQKQKQSRNGITSQLPVTSKTSISWFFVNTAVLTASVSFADVGPHFYSSNRKRGLPRIRHATLRTSIECARHLSSLQDTLATRQWYVPFSWSHELQVNWRTRPLSPEHAAAPLWDPPWTGQP